MAVLSLRFGCGWYDRIEPLMHRTVRPDGIDLRIEIVDDPRALFDRLVEPNGLDVAEFSISEYIAMIARGERRFVGLPIFTSRTFRHSFICVNAESGISVPKDLEGRRIGVPLYTMSAALWCRGLLRDQYGVDLSNVHWVEGAIEKPGPHGSWKTYDLAFPAHIERNLSRLSLTELLEQGHIDATLGALMPTTFGRSSKIKRLFPNFREVETESYRRSGVHPIMHIVVVKRAIAEVHPWVLASLENALIRAKKVALDRLYYLGAPKSLLPLLHAEVEETRAIFGDDPWPDGVEANRRTLDRLLAYMVDDGILRAAPTLEQLFGGIAGEPKTTP